MTDKEKKEIVDSVTDFMQERVDAAVKAGIEQLTAKFEEQSKAAEEIKASIEAANKSLDESKAEFQASINDAIKTLTQKVEEDAEKVEAATEDAEVENESAKPMEASVEMKDIPSPTATQSVVPNPAISAADEKAKKISEIQASSLSGIEKIRAITKLRYA